MDLLGGSISDFIAGENIKFLPGFHAHSGSQVNAYITSDGNYCQAPIANNTFIKNVYKSMQTETNNNNLQNADKFKTIKVYPNPSNGRFYLELTKFDEPATIQISNLSGLIVYRKIIDLNQTEIELENIEKGLYFIIVSCGKITGTQKIIIN